MSMRGTFTFLHRHFHLLFAAAGFLLAIGLTSGCGQQFAIAPVASSRSVVTDWTTRQVKFSAPGSEADAIRAGRHTQWLRVMKDPRYQMQAAARNAPRMNFDLRLPRAPFRRAPIFGGASEPMHRDWGLQIQPANGFNDGLHAGFPAKFNFDIDAAPSCSDYVVFPVGLAGSTIQANIVGFDNLFDATCPSSAAEGQAFTPTVKFAYYVDTGNIFGSPVLSEDGAKVAFVTYTSNAITFHVITLGTSGNNGTAYSAPVQPCTVNGVQSCTTNNAVDISLTLSTSISTLPAVSYTSPFVDYSNDIAYAGDEAGSLHKIAGVFRGVPTESTGGGWPFTVATGYNALSAPVYDSVSQHIFVNEEEGRLYCIDISSGNPTLCSTPYVDAGGLEGVLDGPVVDSTAGTVFAFGESSEPIVTQATIGLRNVVQATVSDGSGNRFDGDFDNAYYNGNYSSGYLYVCGSTHNYYPTLYRIGFDSNGTMKNTTDGNSYPLTFNGSTCWPLTEAYNPNQNKDYLFVGVSGYGNPAGCNGQACVMSFELGTTFPSAPAATLPLGTGNADYSGIIVDNVSTATGASQIIS